MMRSIYSFLLILGCFAVQPALGQTETNSDLQKSDDPNVVQAEATEAEPEIVLSALQQAIRTELENQSTSGSSQRVRAKDIKAWYEGRNFQPIWIEHDQVSKKTEKVIYTLLTAYRDGLKANIYGDAGLATGVTSNQPEVLAAFEVKLSNAAVLYGQHLRSGRVQPNNINKELVIYPDRLSAGTLLDRLAKAEVPATELATLSPQTDRYARLKNHLLNLKVQEADGGWPAIEEGKVLKPDMEDERLETLRRRLTISGDLARNAHQGNVYDGELVEAVKRFQARMGLETDGIIGPATLSQLNISVQERIALVELNLERRRWMQADFGEVYVFVNLADQVLKLVKDEKTIHAELVQVGQPYHRTPVFNEQMEYLEFNPYWNVPYSIATKEYLPKLKQNPYVLQSQNIRPLVNGHAVNPGAVPWRSYSRGRFPVRLRQDPGPKNALGRVKFMFPNQFNVYIHDTPSKSKFTKDSRYFSHGCIRLRSPVVLAEKILAMQGVSKSRIDSILGSGKRKVVKLKSKIPVHVTYLTAWVNKDGSVHYRRDVYGRDKVLAKALDIAV